MCDSKIFKLFFPLPYDNIFMSDHRTSFLQWPGMFPSRFLSIWHWPGMCIYSHLWPLLPHKLDDQVYHFQLRPLEIFSLSNAFQWQPWTQLWCCYWILLGFLHIPHQLIHNLAKAFLPPSAGQTEHPIWRHVQALGAVVWRSQLTAHVAYSCPLVLFTFDPRSFFPSAAGSLDVMTWQVIDTWSIKGNSDEQPFGVLWLNVLSTKVTFCSYLVSQTGMSPQSFSVFGDLCISEEHRSLVL